jgi:hypothetical protein
MSARPTAVVVERSAIVEVITGGAATQPRHGSALASTIINDNHDPRDQTTTT